MAKAKVFAALAVIGAFVACDDEVGPTEVETFIATLTGGAERPTPVNTGASGVGTLSLVGPTVLYRIDVRNITNVTAAHIHAPADTGNPAGVVVDLCGTTTSPACRAGTTAQDRVLVAGAATSVTLGVSFDSVLAWVRTGRAYVNVHTTAFAAGEIRGQLTRQ